MEQHSGRCVGGPHDGQMLVHWSKSKKFYRPLPQVGMGDSAQVETIEIGEYKLNEFGQWHWWASKEGNAYDTLYGA